MNVKSAEFTITASGIHKHYKGGEKDAGLNGFNLRVRAGTVCGLLGPNGAGKTTAVRIFATLLQPDAGQASVAGYDVVRQARQVRENIGLVGQAAAVDELLTASQNLVMFGRLNHLSHQESQRRAVELLEQFVLGDSRQIPVSKFSGGMRRRLDLAVSLITSPPVLFVDEPTTGLDPIGRREVWNALRSRVSQGMTILLTTQYLEEADQLASHVAMLKAGRVVAEGTPDELKSGFGSDWLDITLASDADVNRVKPVVAQVAAGDIHTDNEASRISVPVRDRTSALIKVAAALTEAGIEPVDIALRRPTLDEVFIHLASTETTEHPLEVAS